jgi:hypothetical protein
MNVSVQLANKRGLKKLLIEWGGREWIDLAQTRNR